MSGLTRPAATAELAWIAPVATRAQLVAGAAELAGIAATEPWRVRVTEKGEAALLARWRDHLDDCAVLGLWCSPRRVPVLITDLLEVAREQGYARLLGPLVPEDQSGPYLEAGLRVVARVVVMRLDLRGRPPATRIPGTRIPRLVVRTATERDLDDVMRLDEACFEPFWRYDREGVERLARSGHMLIGTYDGRVVGYTLATSRAGDASLGRLAVEPAARRSGIGRVLADEAVAWMVRQGARSAVLSTQVDNAASRSLYRGMGFRETGDVLVACASSSLVRGMGEGR